MSVPGLSSFLYRYLCNHELIDLDELSKENGTNKILIDGLYVFLTFPRYNNMGDSNSISIFIDIFKKYKLICYADHVDEILNCYNYTKNNYSYDFSDISKNISPSDLIVLIKQFINEHSDNVVLCEGDVTLELAQDGQHSDIFGVMSSDSNFFIAKNIKFLYYESITLDNLPLSPNLKRKDILKFPRVTEFDIFSNLLIDLENKPIYCKVLDPNKIFSFLGLQPELAPLFSFLCGNKYSKALNQLPNIWAFLSVKFEYDKLTYSENNFARINDVLLFLCTVQINGEFNFVSQLLLQGTDQSIIDEVKVKIIDAIKFSYLACNFTNNLDPIFSLMESSLTTITEYAITSSLESPISSSVNRCHEPKQIPIILIQTCKKCMHIFTNARLYAEHELSCPFNASKTTPIIQTCNKCMHIFTNAKLYAEHELSCPSNASKTNPLVVVSPETMHINIPKDLLILQYYCRGCFNSFEAEHELEKHCKDKEHGFKKSIDYTYLMNYNYQKKLENIQSNVVASNKNDKFISDSPIIKHSYPLDLKPSIILTCEKCTNLFTTAEKLASHKLNCINSTFQDKSISKILKRPVDNIFNCTDCDASFNAEDSLKSHCYARRHRMPMFIPSTAVFYCKDCSASFNAIESLESHCYAKKHKIKTNRVEKIPAKLKHDYSDSVSAFICPECRNHFDSKIKLEVHFLKKNHGFNKSSLENSRNFESKNEKQPSIEINYQGFNPSSDLEAVPIKKVYPCSTANEIPLKSIPIQDIIHCNLCSKKFTKSNYDVHKYTCYNGNFNMNAQKAFGDVEKYLQSFNNNQN